MRYLEELAGFLDRMGEALSASLFPQQSQVIDVGAGKRRKRPPRDQRRRQAWNVVPHVTRSKRGAHTAR